MERFLRLLNYDKSSHTIKDMSFQICKFSLNESCFLNYRPSQIAACSVLIAINIYEENKIKKACKKPCSKPLNLDFWNSEIASITGYSIMDLKDCLYSLSSFISSSLSPNRLATFDIEAIKDIQPSSQVEVDLDFSGL